MFLLPSPYICPHPYHTLTPHPSPLPHTEQEIAKANQHDRWLTQDHTSQLKQLETQKADDSLKEVWVWVQGCPETGWLVWALGGRTVLEKTRAPPPTSNSRVSWLPTALSWPPPDAGVTTHDRRHHVPKCAQVSARRRIGRRARDVQIVGQCCGHGGQGRWSGLRQRPNEPEQDNQVLGT